MKTKIFFLLVLLFSMGFCNNVNAQYNNMYQFNNAFMNYAQQSWYNYQNQMYQNQQLMYKRQRQLQEQWAKDASSQIQRNINNNSNNTNYNSSSSSNSNGNASQSNRYTNKTCHGCHGSGKCNTCNGKGWYERLGVSGAMNCPNCSNGRCSICGGSGQVRGLR